MSVFICSICEIEFPIESKAKRNKRCVPCHRETESERRMIWRFDNRDKVRASEKQGRELRKTDAYKTEHRERLERNRLNNNAKQRQRTLDNSGLTETLSDSIIVEFDEWIIKNNYYGSMPSSEYPYLTPLRKQWIMEAWASDHQQLKDNMDKQVNNKKLQLLKNKNL